MTRRIKPPKPNLFVPNDNSNVGVLRELLTEAARVVSVIDKLHQRHSLEIEAARAICRDPRIVDDPDGFVRDQVVRKLFEFSQPENFDFEFHELRRRTLSRIEEGVVIDVATLFKEASTIFGIQPLYRAIWSAQQTLDTIYQKPSSPTEPPVFETGMFLYLQLDRVLLYVYLSVAQAIGEAPLLTLLGFDVDGKRR